MELENDRPSFSSNRFRKLSVDDSKLLEIPFSFSEEEVWSVVRLSGSSKARGPDGFNFKFIKQFLETIKGDILRALQWF